jgi:putative thioredoxin
MTAHEENRFADALELMNQALAKDPSNSDLKINIARVIFTQDDKVGSLALLDSLSDDDKNKPDAVKLLTEIKMSDQLENTPDLDQIEQRLVDNPNDCEALLHKSHHLSANGDHELAMDCLIKIILVDRQFEDDAGHKGLLAMFDMLGGENTSVQKYRRKLFTLLH